jgi:hypothetical protein
MTGHKLRESERWKRRRRPQPPAPVVVMLAPTALMPPPPSAPAPPALTAVDRTRIARWVAAQIVSYPTDRCLRCRRPIVFGAKRLELVNDNARARFHVGCEPVWRAEQEELARRALGISMKEKTSP